MNRLAISLAALTFSLSAPAIAFADARPAPEAAQLARAQNRGEQAKGRADKNTTDKSDKGDKARGDKGQFPMKAETFHRVIDMRIQHAREKLERVLERKDLPAAQEAQMKSDFERSADVVKAAVAKAEADGTVTKEEAKAVRELVKDTKEYMQKKHGKAVGHGKDADKANKGRNRARKS